MNSKRKMLLQPLVIALLSIFKFSTEDKQDLISLTADFIKTHNSPVKLSSFICWDKENTKTFLKTLSRQYQIKIFNITREEVYHGIPDNQLFILDLNCNNSIDILNWASYLNLFRQPFQWIFYGGHSHLTNYYFGVDSKVFTITSNNSTVFTINTIYKHERNESKFVENSLAVWTKQDGFFHFNALTISRNRTNLMGTLIKVSYVLTNLNSLNHLWDYRDKHIDAITKLNHILVHHLVDFLNASSEMMIQPTWGYKNATTGLYSGMAGDLQRGLADLGGTPLFFTTDRVDVIDYIAATTPTYMRFIFRAPPLSYVTNVFTLPFDANVWHYSFVMVAIIAVCVYIIVLWEWWDPQFRQKINDKYNALRPDFFDVVMMDIGAITQQGTDVEPKSNAGRIATLFTFITLMFMYTSYSANIVALLQSTTDSIQSLEDLLNSRIRLGVHDIVYAHYYFETATEPVRKAIYEQKVAPKGQKPNFMTVEEGMRRVQQGFFAFHVELSNGYKIVSDMFQENEKCGLKEITYLNIIEPWLSMKKNSPYKEIMKVGMHKIHESGIQKREVLRIYTTKPVCHTRGSNFGSVGLIDCYSAFLIFAVGILLAIGLLVLEVIVMRLAIHSSKRK